MTKLFIFSLFLPAVFVNLSVISEEQNYWRHLPESSLVRQKCECCEKLKRSNKPVDQEIDYSCFALKSQIKKIIDSHSKGSNFEYSEITQIAIWLILKNKNEEDLRWGELSTYIKALEDLDKRVHELRVKAFFRELSGVSGAK